VCPLSPAPPLRILNPQEAEELAQNRGAWADLWRAIAREADADRLDESRDDDNTNDTESDGDPERDAA
jgi:hypothetical protein